MLDTEITDETFKKLDQWYIQQFFNHYRQMATIAAAQAHQQHQEVAAAVVAAASVQQQQQKQSPQLQMNEQQPIKRDLKKLVNWKVGVLSKMMLEKEKNKDASFKVQINS